MVFLDEVHSAVSSVAGFKINFNDFFNNFTTGKHSAMLLCQFNTLLSLCTCTLGIMYCIVLYDD